MIFGHSSLQVSIAYQQLKVHLYTCNSCKELDWEQTGEQQEERQVQLHGDSNQKSAEVPTQKWWGVVGGEE